MLFLLLCVCTVCMRKWGRNHTEKDTLKPWWFLFSFKVNKLWNHVLCLQFQRTYTHTRAHASTFLSARSAACQAHLRRRGAAVTRKTLNHFAVTTLGRQGSHMGGRQKAEASGAEKSVKTWQSQSGAGINCDGRKKEIWALTWISVRSSRLSLKRWFLWKEKSFFKLMDGFIFIFIFYFFGEEEEEGETTDARSWSLSDSTHALSLQNPPWENFIRFSHQQPGWADVKQAAMQNLTGDAGVRASAASTAR